MSRLAATHFHAMKADVTGRSRIQPDPESRSQPHATVPNLISKSSSGFHKFRAGCLLQRDLFVSIPKVLSDGRWELSLTCHEVRLSRNLIIASTISPAHSKMARSRKELADGKTVVKATGSSGSTAASSELPTFLQFPLLLLLTWSLSALLYTVASEFSAGDLAVVSRSVNEWWEIGSLAAFKVIPLAAGWWGHFDAYDLGAVTLLAKFPTLFLLNSFYGIRLDTFLVSLFIDVLSVVLPFSLLRPLTAAHTNEAPARSITNRNIISDPYVQFYTSLFGAGVYTLILALTFYTWLPVYLVQHFDALTSLELTHDAVMIPKLFMSFIPLGFAARIFLFTPSTSAKSDLGDIRRKSFNPQTSSLTDTLEHNFWGFSKRVRVLLARTGFLAAYTGFNTLLQCYLSVEGSEWWGAAAWAAVWAVSSAGVGAAYWWVADVQEVKN